MSHNLPGNDNQNTDTSHFLATVLVVDDEANIVTLLETWLETIGCRVISASDGEEGVVKAMELKPDLILLDGMMPKMSGFDACSKLKSHPETCEIPVIFLTVQGEVQDVVKGLEAGAHGYMTKPFKPQELLARVRSTLKLKQIQDRLKSHTTNLRTHWNWVHGAISELPVGLMVFHQTSTEIVFTNTSWRTTLGLDLETGDAGLIAREIYSFLEGDQEHTGVFNSDLEIDQTLSLRIKGVDHGSFHLRVRSFEKDGLKGRQILLL